MPKSDPPRKPKQQSQSVTRQTGSAPLRPFANTAPANPDPSYPKEAFEVVVSQQSMSGPLPAPHLVAGYNDIIENGAERIMVMAEKEQDGRLEDNKAIRDFNKRAIKGYNFRGAFGQIAGAASVIGMLWLGYILASEGKQELASILFRYTIIAVVAVFVTGNITKAINSKSEGPPVPVEEK